MVLGDEFQSAAYGVLTEVDGAAEFGVKGEAGCVLADEFAEGQGGKDRCTDAVIVEGAESECVEQ